MTEIPQKEKKVEVITANSNPRIKELNKLNKDAKLRKDRDVFVVEGIRMFRELPLQNVQEVYLSESALKEYRDEFKSMGVLDGRNTWILSDGVFAGVSQTKTPQGCMAVVKCTFGQALRQAAQAGVAVLARCCTVTPDSLTLGEAVPVRLSP